GPGLGRGGLGGGPAQDRRGRHRLLAPVRGAGGREAPGGRRGQRAAFPDGSHEPRGTRVRPSGRHGGGRGRRVSGRGRDQGPGAGVQRGA
ncbi:MAG: hypothetical protein AVDCRST_MAG12-2238, partial [uncultured Rubrobacteraceae bacterium]